MLIGFYNINSFINNNIGTVNPIGELSELGNTYSRTISQYAGTKGNLSIFDVGDLTISQRVLTQQVCTQIAGMLDNIVNYNTSSGNLLANFQAELGNTVTNLSLGLPILNPDDNQLYPTWIQFDTVQQGLVWTFKIWLSDTDFRNNYPAGHIQLIFPISNLAHLFSDYTGSAAIVNALKPTSLTILAANQVTDVVTGYDEMTIRVYNANDITQFFDFPVLVAFNGGDLFCNRVNYFKAFKDAILAVPGLTLAQWLTVIPSLEPLNKYYVLPNWINTAIVNLAVQSPICSPTILVSAPDAFAAKYFPDYTLQQVSDYLNYTVAMYKSLGLYIVPDLLNLDGRLPWRVKLPDYFLVSLNDLNIQQMSVATQNVVVLLDRMIRFAETYTVDTVLPDTITIEKRGTLLYACSSIENIQLCVLTRASSIATG